MGMTEVHHGGYDGGTPWWYIRYVHPGGIPRYVHPGIYTPGIPLLPVYTPGYTLHIHHCQHATGTLSPPSAVRGEEALGSNPEINRRMWRIEPSLLPKV